MPRARELPLFFARGVNQRQALGTENSTTFETGASGSDQRHEHIAISGGCMLRNIRLEMPKSAKQSRHFAGGNI
jgi:hypothetical protein